MLEKIALAPAPPAVALEPIDKARLLAWSDALVAVPDGFKINRKLVTQFERRKATITQKNLVDWGMAEGLAFASLLASGVPVRLTGQDTERGTFSHRHAVLHDPSSNATYVPLQHVDGARASFEIFNSPLSEYACVGFEYGYAAEVPAALVLWEAQFGDFVNGAQIVIDQFIAAGQAKWGQTSRLTLLLPHGYEGQGPEHSSARLERFLQLAAEGNLRVAYPSTAGNYFHLLRLQAGMPNPVPLVVMTPKSLLRLEVASGDLDDMASGSFKPIVDDPRAIDKSSVERIVLCSGKIYYDLTASERYAALKKTAIVRIELLSPMPGEAIKRDARLLSQRQAPRLGAGRAQEHGGARVRSPAAHRADAAAARHRLHRAFVSGEPVGRVSRGARRRARTRHRSGADRMTFAAALTGTPRGVSRYGR